MEQGIITLEDSCKKFILDLIVPYDESYNLKKEEGELFEIDELIKEYSNNFIDSIKLKILKPKIMGDIDFMYLDLDKDLNHKYYLKPLEEKNVTLRNTWIDLKKEYITHYLMMCNFNPPEAYFRTGELQQENFYYSILSKDKDSNKITGKVFRYYFAKKCLDARQNTVIGRYSKVEEKNDFKKLNDVFKSCSLHV